MAIGPAQFFREYLDPHKREVAEWGAQVGFWHRDRTVAIERVVKLAESAISQAGLDSSARLNHCRMRLDKVEKLQRSMRFRVFESFARMTGAESFSSPSRLHNFLESALDIAAIVFLPIFLVVILPYAAMARRALHKSDERESRILALKEAAKTYLIVWFEVHVDRGELAARIKNGEFAYEKQQPSRE